MRLSWGFVSWQLVSLVGLACSAAPFLLQRIYLRAHCDDLLLFFCGLAPGVFFIQKMRFVLVLSAGPSGPQL